MIGRVARGAVIAAVVADVLRIVGAQAAQAVRGQQAPGTDVHHGASLCLVQRTVWERDGKELVRPQTWIVASGAVQDVVAVAQLEFQKRSKPRSRLAGHALIRAGIREVAQTAGEAGQAAQCVVPQRVDYRLADAWGYYPVVQLGVHPGESCTSADPP